MAELSSIYIHIIPITVILVIAFIVNALLKRTLTRVEEMQKQNADRTKFNFLKNSVGIVVYTIALILIINSIPALKNLGTALFAGAGVIAAIVGFASQAAFSNIVSGIFILIFKPFRIGDVIEFKAGMRGVVTDITFRQTVIKDYENKRIIIPNSIISEETIINSSIEEEAVRKHIHFGISYDANIDDAIAIIKEEIVTHPKFLDRRTAKEKKQNVPIMDVRVIAWGESSIDLRAYVWSKSYDDASALQCDVLKSIKERFDESGIEIPYPHRTIITKNA